MTDPVTIVHDDLVPDPVVQREFAVSAMTIWRWDHDPELLALGWPLPVHIRRRNYRSRAALTQFKVRVLGRATTQRSAAHLRRPIPS